MKAEKLNEDQTEVDVLVNHLWKAVLNHSRRGHWLRLVIDDFDQTLWCIWCHRPLVGGSEAVMQGCTKRMKDCGIEFEVIICTNHNYH